MSDFEQQLRDQLHEAASRFEPSASLGGRIDGALRRVGRSAGAPGASGARWPWRSGAWAWATAAAALVLIAVLVPLATLSGGPASLRPAHGKGGHQSTSTTPTTTASSTTLQSTSTTTSQRPTTTTSTTAPAAGLPSGSPVPAGFQPASVTFVSSSTGFVLGVDRDTCHGGNGCLALVRTTDGGSIWEAMSAPPAGYVNPTGLFTTGGRPTVDRVRFADPLDGWAFGPSLFATHDGARTWQEVNVGGSVVALETAGGFVDAVVSPCQGIQECSGSLRLEQASASGGAFQTVRTGPSVLSSGLVGQDLSLQPSAGFASLGLRPQAGQVAGTAVLYASGDLADHGSWHPFADPCSGSGFGLAAFVAPDSTELYSLCAGNGAAGSMTKVVVRTDNGTSVQQGSLPLPGDPDGLAATSSGTLVVSAASGASSLYRSTDGGKTWTTAVTYDDGGSGFVDLGFTTATQGVAVHGLPDPPDPQGGSHLLMTHDGGATWQVVSFS